MAASTQTSRHVPCPGAFNVRDLGGYAAADGRTVRWRMLFRADGLHRIPVDARAPMNALAWRTVLDLRTMEEYDAGRFSGDGIEVLHLPVLRSTWDADAFAAAVDPVAFLVERYLEMAAEGAASLAAAFDVLASPIRLPAVFHCSAGKDRTGVLAALVLCALGVSDDDIAADYALSEAAMTDLIEWIRGSMPEAATQMVNQPATFLACPPAAMTAFLAELRADYGSVEGYLRSIGVETSTLLALRSTLLEPRPD